MLDREIDLARHLEIRETAFAVSEEIECLRDRAIGGVLDGHDPVLCRARLDCDEDVFERRLDA